MRYSDFLLYVEIIEEFKYEDIRNQRINAAFTAWLMGAAPKKTFQQMCRQLGLVESVEVSPGERKAIAEHGYNIAARIVELDQGKGGG